MRAHESSRPSINWKLSHDVFHNDVVALLEFCEFRRSRKRVSGIILVSQSNAYYVPSPSKVDLYVVLCNNLGLQ